MGFRPESRRAAMLHELCTQYGYCNELKADAITESSSIEEIVDSVLVAEGVDPAMTDRKIHAFLARVVDDWLFDPQGRGAKSGLAR